MTAVCTSKIIKTGPAKSVNSHSFRDNSAMAKNRLNEALPITSIARSNISKLNTMVNALRIITPPANAQTKVGSSNAVPCATMVIKSANAKAPANNAKLSIVEEAVIRRMLSGFSNISSCLWSSSSVCLVLYNDCLPANFSTSLGFGLTGVGLSPILLINRRATGPPTKPPATKP